MDNYKDAYERISVIISHLVADAVIVEGDEDRNESDAGISLGELCRRTGIPVQVLASDIRALREVPFFAECIRVKGDVTGEESVDEVIVSIDADMLSV